MTIVLVVIGVATLIAYIVWAVGADSREQRERTRMRERQLGQPDTD